MGGPAVYQIENAGRAAVSDRTDREGTQVDGITLPEAKDVAPEGTEVVDLERVARGAIAERVKWSVAADSGRVGGIRLYRAIAHDDDDTVSCSVATGDGARAGD